MRNQKRPGSNSKGMATIEALPLIVIFVMLMSYGLGFFGIIHSAILQSIASRTYAFETFRNRTNLTYFRDSLPPESNTHYVNWQVRVHGIVHESQPEEADNWYATSRPLAIGRGTPRRTASRDIHVERIYNLDFRNRNIEVSPAWIMIGYGMCINANCGD